MGQTPPLIYVIPEDDADRQIANGFVLYGRVNQNRVKVAAPAGGYLKVLDIFKSEYVRILQGQANVYVIMLIDFDDDFSGRRKYFEEHTPATLHDRVFVVGPRVNPEVLKRALNMTLEDVGLALAHDCDIDGSGTWNHEMLRHNDAERHRLMQKVRSFIVRS